MMFAKVYLILVAVLYLALAIWCTVAPKTTSGKVGFELVSGTGKSEFMTVYGGLELGLALVLLAAVFRPETVGWGVSACVLIHASLVLFRSLSLFRFDDIGAMTYQLAAGEWLILIMGLIAMWLQRGTSSG